MKHLLFISLLALIVSCSPKVVEHTTTEYVTKHDTIYKHKVDSFVSTEYQVIYKDRFLRDSIIIYIDTIGNVVSKEKYHDSKVVDSTSINKSDFKAVTDTFIVGKVDTVYRDKKVVETKEKIDRKGWGAFFVLLAIFAVVVTILIKRK